MKKKVIVCILAIVMMIALPACSSPPANEPAAEPSTGTDTTSPAPAGPADLVADITMWTYPRLEDEEDFWNDEVVAMFNQTYPNISVSVTVIPWDGGPEKVNTAIASGNAPDILFDSDMRGNGYASRGVLVPLNDVLSSFTGIYEDFWMDKIKIGDDRYMAPIYTAGGPSLLVNVALAEQYGIADMLPEDHMSWTLDEFYDFVKAATDAGKSSGVYGITMFAGSQSSDSNTMGWLMGSGTTVLNSDTTAITLNTAGAAQTLDFMGKLVKDGLAIPGAASLIDDETIELFLGGKAVTSQYGDLWMVNMAYDRKESGEITGPMDAQFYLFPTLSGKPGNNISYGATGLMIFDNNDADKIAAAKEFISFYMNSEQESTFVENAGQMACRSGVVLFSSRPDVSREVERMGTFSPYQMGNWGNQLGYWSEIRAVFYPEIQAVYASQKDGQAALDSFAANADKIIAENQ